jgi:hypothetical protein
MVGSLAYLWKGLKCLPEKMILGEMVNFQKVNLPKHQLAKNINQSIVVILFLGRHFDKLTFWQVDFLEVDHSS